MRINTRQLSHDKASRTFVAEASDIGYNGVSQTIDVQSERTGVTVEFQYTAVERTDDEDNEIVRWVYTISRASVTKMPALAGYKLTILND